jgi:hypothetical protein
LSVKTLVGEEHVTGFYKIPVDRMKIWGKPEAFRGLLFGAAIFFIPGIGSHVEFGGLAGWTVGGVKDGIRRVRRIP